MSNNLSFIEIAFSTFTQFFMIVSAFMCLIGWLPLIIQLFRYSNKKRLTEALKNHKKLPKRLFILSFAPLILFLIFSISFMIHSAINGINADSGGVNRVYGFDAVRVAAIYLALFLIISFTYIPFNIVTLIAAIKYQHQYLKLKKSIPTNKNQ